MQHNRQIYHFFHEIKSSLMPHLAVTQKLIAPSPERHKIIPTSGRLLALSVT